MAQVATFCGAVAHLLKCLPPRRSKCTSHGKKENKSWSNVNHENHGIKNIYVRIIWIIQFVIKMKFRIIYERKKGQITQ